MCMQLETIRVNVLGMLNLADICFEKKIHLTTYATGCIFHYDKDFPEGSGKGFKEADKPNFTGSYYSYTKVCICLAYCLEVSCHCATRFSAELHDGQSCEADFVLHWPHQLRHIMLT